MHRNPNMWKRPNFSAAQLRKCLSYDPETGIFKWKIRPGISKPLIGDIAGGVDHNGYVRIRLFKRRYLGHRLAWLYMTGRWPMHDLDHINMVRSDNRWENLRKATRAQNSANAPLLKSNSSGARGIKCVKRKLRPDGWLARIVINKKYFHLGTFDQKSDAINAYNVAAQAAWGQFVRTLEHHHG